MNYYKEQERLRNGSHSDEVPDGAGLVRFVITCPNNSSDVLTRAREVLESILCHSGGDWPADERWREVLPSWFVSTCAPDMTNEEAAHWLGWWRSLPFEKQAQAEREKKWTLSNWIYWFNPEERQWYWWDASITSPSSFEVVVEVKQWPVPWGSLNWLLRASGADTVEIAPAPRSGTPG